MTGSKRLKIVFVLFFVLGAAVFSQDKQGIVDQDKGLREEILTVFQSKGEQGLRDFFKEKVKEINGKFIVDLAEAGEKERKEEWLKACEILAEEKKDEKTFAEILYRMAKYLIFIPDNEKAMEYLSNSLNIFKKLKDLKGQGDVYLGMGAIYLLTEGNSKALAMFDKALPLYQKSKDSKGQGNIYYYKGAISLRMGDYSNALLFYEKALTFFNKVEFFTGIGNVYYGKGSVYLSSGNSSKGLEMYDKAQSFFEKAGDIMGQGNISQCIGDYYLSISDYLKALEIYDKALILFKKIDNLIGIGQNLFRKGVIYTITGKYEQAIDIYNEALPFFEKANHPAGQGSIYQRLGDIYFYKEENLTALRLYNKSIKFLKKADDIINVGNLLLRKGDIYLRMGDKSKALLMYGEALTSYKKVSSITGQGIIYQRYGSIYTDNGDYSRALRKYEKALNIYEKTGDLLEIANIYFKKGGLYFNTGFNSKALDMYGIALLYYEKVKNPIGQQNVFQNLGNIYFRTGNNIKALEMCAKALNLLERTEHPSVSGYIYKKRGDIFKGAGNNQKALELYEKALSFFKKSENSIGQGDIYLSKGDVYLWSGDYSTASKMYEQALVYFEKVDHQNGIGNIFGCKGEIYFYIGDNSKALDMYDKAFIFFTKVGDLLGQGNIYKRKGDIFFRTGGILGALDMYEKALSIYNKIGDITSESDTLYEKGKVLGKQGKKIDAINLFERSISGLEKYRFQSAIAELKKIFLGAVYNKYEEVALFMLKSKYYEKGFTYVESMRARVFLDQMAEALVPLDKGLNPQLKEDRDLLVGKLSALSRQIQETNGKEQKKLQELKEEYRKVESQFDDLLIKIRLENPLYASVNYPQPISVQDLQNDILKEGETMLSYFISQDESYAFVISKNNFHVQPLKLTEKEVNSSVERYLLAIKGNNANDMNRYGNRLYEKLFKPLEKYLEKGSDIIIVPSGQLETIPFESLIVDRKNPGSPVYLLEKYRLKYVQSATLLSILRKNYNGDSAAKGFIGFGDPVYDYENFKQGKPEQGSATKAPSHQELFYNNIFGVPLCLSAFVAVSNTKEKEDDVVDEIKEIHRDRFARAGGVMDRLPESGQEVQAIAQLFEKESLNNAIHLRDQATEDNAKADNMKDFAYIHFSCHGLLNDDFQCLVLSQLPPDKSKEDGYLTLNEIMNCNYNARLVVLSACETGSGKMIKGEGVTGLTRAVMYAGTPAVVASLWKVDDVASKELMIAFYKNMLQKNMDKAEALRQAKLELLKGKYASPLYWSAFVMYGE